MFSNLFLIFIGIYLTVFVVIGFLNIKNLLGKIFLTVVLLHLFYFMYLWIRSEDDKKVTLTKEDYYGDYVINRKYFKGKDADWQFNHFQFKIAKNDTLYFYILDGKKVIKTLKRKISTIRPFDSDRLVINYGADEFHVLNQNPTTYRSNKGFYLVLNSIEYGNMFFIKKSN